MSAINPLNEMVGSFSLIGPLPNIDPGNRSDYFIESELAHGQYLGHRSVNAPDNTMTYHVVHTSGDVVGFISFRVQREDGIGSTRIFVSIEHIYVMQGLRRQGLTTLLLCPLVLEVQEALHRATGPSRRPKIHIYSASLPESASGNRVVHELEQQLWELSKRNVGVDLIGRHQEYPPGAHQRLWARTLAEPEETAALYVDAA